jgi:HAD superfamily hydrolase (TIGR01509 family)
MTCLIFDCDGVLVDSEISTTKHFIKELSRLGYELTTEACLRRFTGLSAQAVYEEINQELGGILTAEKIKTMQSQVHAGMHAEIKAVAGIADLLATLQSQKTLAFCLASSGSFEKINKSLQVTQLSSYFPATTIFSAQQVKKGKPEPDLFLYAAEQMGYPPEACIVIEDSETGIKAALAASMRVIGFLGGSHAGYEWYQAKIKAYAIPMAETSEALSQLLRKEF